MTTREQISEWFDIASADADRRYVLVIHDSFSHMDYPIYASLKNFAKVFNTASSYGMQRVGEVYDTQLSKEYQLSESKAMHPPEGFMEKRDVFFPEKDAEYGDVVDISGLCLFAGSDTPSLWNRIKSFFKKITKNV